MRTAKAWNRTPEEWDELSDKDKARMIAFDNIEMLMRNREIEEPS